ncbi:MAG: AMP-dependent synthetase/ligase [Alphaproteobacteria bacterium]
MSVEPAEPDPRFAPSHLGAIFFHRVEQLGDRPFLKLQRGEKFEAISWRDFGALVQSALLALYDQGLAAGERVAIIGENCLAWCGADLATLAGGLPNVVVSPALSDAMLLRILGQAGCRAAFVQNAAGYGRLLKLQSQLPQLSHIIVMEDTDANPPHAISFARLLEQGSRVAGSRLFEILDSIHPNDMATLMYTAGSTGEPKGVIRTQDNLLSNISNGRDIILSRPDEVFVIVLSLNHLYGRFGFLKSAVTGRTTAIIAATEAELDCKIIESAGGTSMAVVPRVMESILNSIFEEGEDRHLWQQLETLDQRQMRDGHLNDIESQRFHELRARLRTTVRKALGGRIEFISYAGAAMPPRIIRFFELIDLPLIGSYGSTECGGVSLGAVAENRPGNLDKPFPNVEIRIGDDGEILVRGPTVTPGYFQNPQATAEVLEPDGWFHTGDLGTLDADGSLRIVGRKKDVFNCSDGSNIYPGYIEVLLENDPFVRQAVLLGDRRPFIAALLVADLDAIAAALQREESTLTDDDIESALGPRIDQINARLESYEKVRKFVVMKSEFPAEVRSVNVFQKIKVDRKAVTERYQEEIKALYSSGTEGGAL